MELDKTAMFFHTAKMTAAINKACPRKHGEDISCEQCQFDNLCTVIVKLSALSIVNFMGSIPNEE